MYLKSPSMTTAPSRTGSVRHHTSNIGTNMWIALLAGKWRCPLVPTNGPCHNEAPIATMHPPHTSNHSPPHTPKQDKQITQQRLIQTNANNDQPPPRLPVPPHHVDNDPRPRPLHKWTEDEITYLSK